MATPDNHEADTDELITIITRNSHEEIRITLSSYRRHKFVNVRLWAEMKDGVQRPTKKGCTIRLGEIDHVIAALNYAASLADPS